MQKLKHIVIDKINYDTLSQLGKAGQSFNDVLTNVLNELLQERERKKMLQAGLPVGQPAVQPVTETKTTYEGDSDHE